MIDKTKNTDNMLPWITHLLILSMQSSATATIFDLLTHVNALLLPLLAAPHEGESVTIFCFRKLLAYFRISFQMRPYSRL